MAEYIERIAAVHVAEKHGLNLAATDSYAHDSLADVIADEIFKLPTADVRPERHGHWEKFSANVWQCTECKKLFSAEWWYCPHCGAKMDGKEDTK